MLHVGFDNYISTEYIRAICGNPTAAPIKRTIQDMKVNHPFAIMDFTNGHKLKSIIYMNDGSIALSSIKSETLKNRYIEALSLQENPILKKEDE